MSYTQGVLYEQTINGITWRWSLNSNNTATLGNDFTVDDDSGIGGIQAGDANATTARSELLNGHATGLLTIPSAFGNTFQFPLTIIAHAAFRNAYYIKSVILPNSVTRFNANAFRGCSSLTSINMPTSLTTMESDIFRSSAISGSLTIPNSVTIMGTTVFLACTSLTSVTFGTGISSIPNYTCADCTSLSSVIIPNSITSIGIDPFFNTSANLIVTMNTQTINGAVYTSPTTSDISFFGNPSVTLVLPPVPPTMTITSTTTGVTSGSTTNNTSIALTFTSSKATNNFVVGDISVTNGTLSAFTGSGTVYTATFTPSSQGACTIGVAAGAYTDTAQNLNNTAATTFNWTFDNVSPSMTISSTTSGVTTGSTTNNTSIALTFTSTEATNNFVLGDISVTNGSLSAFTAVSSTVYTATFTPTTAGLCTIDVAAGVYTDAATNLNNLATQFTWTFDNVRPTITITSTTAGVTSGSRTNNASIALTFTSSKATINFVVGDISVTNGSLSNFAASSGSVYTATFTPTGQGACTINVAAGAYTDAVGNTNTAATTFTWTFDSISPSMTITSTTSGVTTGSTTNNTSIELTFTSTEATNNFVVEDISVTNGSLTNFAGSGTVYTATFTPTYQGACTIDVAAGAYTDAAGNTNTAATTFNWSLEVVDYGNVTPTSLSFVNNTLTVLNSIDSADVDKVSFDVTAGSLLYLLEVTNLYNANSISYVLDISGGSTVSSGTFTQAGVNLLNGAFLEEATNTTYILTLTSSGSNIYRIVGKSLDAGYTVANALSVGYIPDFASINDANNLEQTYISGFLDVSGEIIHRSNDVTIMDGNLLVISGDVSFNSGNLYVAGNVSMNSIMMVTGETTLTSLVAIGKLDVSGATTLDSTLTVAGATILNNVTNIVDNSIFAVGTGATTMGGNVSLNSQLSVAGDVSMNSTLQVVGATSLKNTTVAGILTLNSTLAFLNDISFNGSRIDICGNLYANYPANSIPAAAFIGGGGNTIDADASMNAGLNVSGETALSSFTVSNNTSVGGTLNATGATTMSSLNTSNNATLGGMLTIASNASFLNDVSFNGSRIDICGNLYARYPNSSIPLSAVSGVNDTVYNTDVSLNARLNVGGATTLASTLAVSGKTTLSNDLSFNGPRIDICGNLFAKYASNSIPQSAIIGGIGSTFTTDVSVNAGIYVQGKVTLGTATMQYKETPNIGVYIDPLTSGNIVTSGNVTVGNILSIAAGTSMSNLNTTGNTVIGGTLIVTGATTSTSLTTSSNAIIGGALTIAGITTFSSDTSMNSMLVVASDVSLNTKVMVMADVSANARLMVGGDVSMNSTMRVAGATTLNAVTIAGALTAANATTINSTLNITGATTIGIWNVTGAVPFTTDVSMNSTLSVGGDVSMNTKLFVAGATTLSQLTASSNGTMGGTLAVTGNSTFAAHVHMNSKLTVIGDVSMNARLAVTTNNATTIGGTLGVLGATTMSTLTTTSDVSINSTLAVTGISTFSGDVSLNGTAVRIAGSLTANGYAFNTASILYKSIIWGQLGTDIDGEAAGDQSGYSVALSKNGNVVAIGANENDGTTTNLNYNGRGHVRVYQRDASQSTGWRQLGSDIEGEPLSVWFGQSVSLSSDGSIVAIGSGLNYGPTTNVIDNRGSVRVYRIDLSNTSGGWIQLGNDIDGEFAGDESGFSVSLSNNGNILAIGGRYNDGTGTVGSNNGHVRVYQINLTDTSGGWTQLGSDINGGGLSENFGYSVSLSGDGSTIAIGAPFNDGTSPYLLTNQGCVRVYQINLSDPFLGWIQQGATIFGELPGQDQSQAGYSVALSNDGLIVAVGQPYNDGTTGVGNNNRGSVRVYKRNESNITVVPNGWTQLGDDIDGEAAQDQSGWSISLSSDGSIIAIGANQNDGSGTLGNDRGHVRVYKIDLNNTELGWSQLGQDIDGEFVADQSGFSVSLSSDGSIVAIGAVYNDGTTGAYGNNRGSVRIYTRDTTIPINGAYISAPLITSNMVTDGYATVGGSLGITGNSNIDKTLSIVGATTMTSLTASSTVTLGGTLTINNATTLSSTLNITGATTTSALTTSSNATVGGTLNVTGATTLTALNYTDKIMQW